MLRIGSNGAGKTELMYGANMSYRQTQKYLKFLISQGLVHKVDVDHSSVTYVVTEKGHGLRRSIDTVLQMLNIENFED